MWGRSAEGCEARGALLELRGNAQLLGPAGLGALGLPEESGGWASLEALRGRRP